LYVERSLKTLSELINGGKMFLHVLDILVNDIENKNKDKIIFFGDIFICHNMYVILQVHS